MDPVDRTPTEAADYAALSLAYASLLGGAAAAARGRAPIERAELTALRLFAPSAGRTVTTVLAVSAGNDFLHSAFALLGAQANTQQQVAEEPERFASARVAA